MNFIHSLFTVQYFLQEEYTTVLGTVCIYTEEINTNLWSSYSILQYIIYYT